MVQLPGRAQPSEQRRESLSTFSSPSVFVQLRVLQGATNKQLTLQQQLLDNTIQTRSTQTPPPTSPRHSPIRIHGLNEIIKIRHKCTHLDKLVQLVPHRRRQKQCKTTVGRNSRHHMLQRQTREARHTVPMRNLVHRQRRRRWRRRARMWMRVGLLLLRLGAVWCPWRTRAPRLACAVWRDGGGVVCRGQREGRRRGRKRECGREVRREAVFP